MKYYVNLPYVKRNHSGFKAPMDANEIFEQNGYQGILSQRKQGSYRFQLVMKLLSLPKLFGLKKSDCLVLNFPHSGFVGASVFCSILWAKKIKRFKVFLLVHDIAGFHGGEPVYVAKLVERADILIVHSSVMEQWYQVNKKTTGQFVVLQHFDYLSEKVNEGGVYGQAIIIAGDLHPRKNGYLKDLYGAAPALNLLTFNLYGANLELSIKSYPNVTYKGSFPTDKILQVLEGSFGLIWHSQELDGGKGPFADYTRYNAPHKFSSYLAAGFPVIVWSQSALAAYVRENNLGLVVTNLTELPEKLSALTEADYQRMKEKVNKIGAQIRSGYFLTRALKKAETLL